jgi:hypothetical protein
MINIPNNLIPQNFKRLSLNEIWKIFKRMFLLLKEQQAFWTPIIRMVFINFTLLFLFIIGILSLIENRISLGVILLIISIIGFIIRGFYFGYLFGMISALVFLYLHGNTLSLKNAKRMLQDRKLSLGILHVLTSLASGFLKNRNNQTANTQHPLLARLLFSSVSRDALDFFGHFLVPVIVLENIDLLQSLKHLQDLRAHIPASLAGLAGVDITNTILSLIFIPFIIGLMILCVFLGSYGVHLFPSNTIITFGNFTLSWLPSLIGILFLILAMSFLRPCMDGLKLIYFSLLYALIRHPEKIQDDKKNQFTNLFPRT